MGKEKGKSAFDEVTSETDPDETKREPVESTDSSPQQPSESSKTQTEDTTTEETTTTSENESKNTTQTSNQLTTSNIADSEPAFPFDSISQRPIYVSDNAWENNDDLRFQTKAILRSQYNVKNTQTRELDEALFTLIKDLVSPEQVAKQLVRNRGFNPDD